MSQYLYILQYIVYLQNANVNVTQHTVTTLYYIIVTHLVLPVYCILYGKVNVKQGGESLMFNCTIYLLKERLVSFLLSKSTFQNAYKYIQCYILVPEIHILRSSFRWWVTILLPPILLYVNCSPFDLKVNCKCTVRYWTHQVKRVYSII